MASLKIVSDRTDDNALKFAVVLPPRRNGEVNFGAAEAINRALLTINPDAFDPVEIPLADGVSATLVGPVDHNTAAAMIRDRVLLTDDDTGAPGEPPRCSTGGCGDD